jgi:hypothetical protein
MAQAATNAVFLREISQHLIFMSGWVEQSERIGRLIDPVRQLHSARRQKYLLPV